MKISQSHTMRAPRRRAAESMILFRIGGTTFAIAAHAVEEIREVDGLQEFKFSASHEKLAKVKHLFERNGRFYFVVDAAAQFRLADARPTRLLVLQHAPAAVLVDGIDSMQDVYSIHELPKAFCGEERGWYRGLTVIKDRVLPVVRPEALLSKAEATLLGTMLRSSRGANELVTA